MHDQFGMCHNLIKFVGGVHGGASANAGMQELTTEWLARFKFPIVFFDIIHPAHLHSKGLVKGCQARISWDPGVDSAYTYYMP